MQGSNKEITESGRLIAAAGLGRKMYYSTTEVCAMTGIVPHILRYWEKEFSLLRPKKSSGGKRSYNKKDIASILRIKRMLEEEKYTLHGAKDKLLDERRERLAGTGRNAAAKKRGKVNAAGNGDGSASTDSSTLDSAASTSSISTPTAAVAKKTRRKSVPKSDKSNNGRVINNDDSSDRGNDYGGDNDNRGNDKELILSVRNELLEVLGLLEP